MSNRSDSDVKFLILQLFVAEPTTTMPVMAIVMAKCTPISETFDWNVQKKGIFAIFHSLPRFPGVRNFRVTFSLR